MKSDDIRRPGPVFDSPSVSDHVEPEDFHPQDEVIFAVGESGLGLFDFRLGVGIVIHVRPS